MRNLSLPVVWEDVDTPEEWERDASAIPSAISKGRYVYWGWTGGMEEKGVLPFNGSTTDWPGLQNLSYLSTSSNLQWWDTSISPPASMGMLFRDQSTMGLFNQGNKPLQQHLSDAGVAPTSVWPAMVYGTLPFAWGDTQQDTGQPTLPNLEVM